MNGYHKKDPHMDYKGYSLIDKRSLLRGPKPTSDKFISCIGAAQTFGRWSVKSYPELLGNEIGIDAYNLSAGGYGPEDAWIDLCLDIINSSEVCIVQVPSARCQSIPSRRLYARGSHYLENGRVVGKSKRKAHMVRGGNRIKAGDYWKREFKTLTKSQAKSRIDEVLDLYIESFKKLFSKIKVPTILLYIGRNPPIDEDSHDFRHPFQSRGPIGTFPHFVTKSTINRLCELSDRYVEYVHGEIDAPVIRNGRPFRNGYYPTQDMYETLAKKLSPVVKNIIET
jgi:hypothetical protein